MRYPPPLIERFDAKWTPEPFSGCWLWTGCGHIGSYGHFQFHGKIVGAHRASWELYRGNIPKGMDVLHSCDVPLCVNPAHLFLGSHQDNMRDMIAKGRHRHPSGEDHPLVKINRFQAEEIRKDSRPQRAIAKSYGIGQATVWRVKNCANRSV